ncbi:hypothetical protein [Nocardia sp. CA-119907]|uniref:hypothetical protein n=1 Tax=Nocardia sp. CA-119907 TaxID=3239973 RepID=UPI003D97AD91
MREIRRAEFLGLLTGAATGVIAGGVVGGAPAGADPAAAEPISVLSGATLIDGTGAAARPDTTIVLAGDRIVAVGEFAELPLPPQVRVVDLAGGRFRAAARRSARGMLRLDSVLATH